MSRLGYFIFNVLLVILIYSVVYFSENRMSALTYTVKCFSIPYILAHFLMAVYSLFHWFVREDSDVANEGITFLNATWVISLLTFIAYELVKNGGVPKLF